MKVHIVPNLKTPIQYRNENIIATARKRKHMCNAEQRRERIGMYFLYTVVR